MASTVTREPSVNPSQHGSPSHGTGRSKPSSVGRWLRRLAGALTLLGLLAGIGAGGVWLVQSQAPEGRAMLTHEVKRGDLVVTITEDGNLESASNLDLKCQVAGGSSILWIVEDGKEVQEGDKLVELDASQLEDQINQQKITFEKARSAVIQAEKDFSVAKLAVQEYLEGVFKQELQTHEAQITIALENLRSAENTLEYSQRMFRKGYISTLELESQQFAVERAKLDLDAARTAKEVLEKFTRVKTIEDLESQRDTAEAKMQSERAAFELEEARLKRLEAQLAQCVLHAPADGMVVYANDTGGRFGGQQQATIEEGAAVRERQTILRLPDLSKMQVKVTVHESKVDSLAIGMRARIRIQDKQYQGTVVSIANQPEPTSFFSASVKEYATIVKIDGEPSGLKPGMTAEVEILLAHLKDTLSVPVASVVEQGGKFYSWVKAADKVERRPLVLGMSNDRFVSIEDGVQEGEQVLLNPRAVVPEARQRGAGGDNGPPEDVAKKFGEAPAGAAPDGAADGRGRGGPGAGGPGAGGPGAGGPGAGGPGAGGPGAGGPGAGGPGAGGPGAGGPGAGGPGAGGPGAGGPGAGGGRRAGGSGRGSRNLMDNDADGDGRVSREEAPERMQNFFDRLDGNGDGFIDESEVRAMQSRMRGAGGPGGAGGGSGPGGGFRGP